MKRETVYGLYSDGWQGLIVPEAFSHPAKFAKGLVYWIVRTGIERGYWQPGDLILDPFAGVGLGGLACAAYGLQFLGVELEPTFIALAEQNFALHEKSWRLMNLPLPRIIQGDSRHLAEILAGVGVAGAVTSPPWQGSIQDGLTERDREHYSPLARHGRSAGTDYGVTPGQLGAMPEGKPPVAAMSGITSPPFGDSDNRGGTKMAGDYFDRIGGLRTQDDVVPSTPGQIANLGGITSPPYEASVSSGRDGIDFAKAGRPDKMVSANIHYPIGAGAPGDFAYNKRNPDNLGNTEGDTYWSACETIYRQLYDLFSPGSHLAVVVKPFVRNKKLVDLPQMTLDLLVNIGFEPVAWIDAMLVAEGEQRSAWPEEVPHKRKARKSFFRLLAERKGSPRIDAEVVLVVRK